MIGLDKRRRQARLTLLQPTLTSRLTWQGGLFSFLLVAVSTFIMFVLEFAPYNVNMVFTLVTLFATIWFGLVAGVVTATLSFLCFDYFFIPPFFTFAIDAFQGWVAVFLFFGTALFANQVAGRARQESEQARQRAQETTALYELATTVITKIDQTEMLLTVLKQVHDTLEAESCILFLTNDNEAASLSEAVRIETSKEPKAARHPDLALVQTSFSKGEAIFFTGLEIPQREGAVAYLPLASGSQRLGVVVVVGQSFSDDIGFRSEEKRLLQVFANHVALAVEHARLIRENAQVVALRDSDKLKSALLASVSHELRTPLTVIKTAVANLRNEETTGKREIFVNMIEQDTDRLTHLVSNLLDLSKLEAGALKPDLGWYYLPEIVEKVVERLQNSPLIQSHRLITSFEGDIPLTLMDYLQIDQVLTNLVENAAKYSPPDRPIHIQVGLKEPSKANEEIRGETGQPVLLIKVLDEGIGIPAGQLEKIFDKFYRVGTGTNVPGTGMGLTISKGIIEAHGGQIWAQNRLYGGTVFTFTLPLVAFSDELMVALA